MALEVEATYENGTLRLAEPLPFKEHERVIVTVRPTTGRARQLIGLMRWTGDPEILRQIAEDPLPEDS